MRRHRGVVHERLQPARDAARIAGAHRAGDRVGGVRGDAARARAELGVDALARGVLGEGAEGAGIGGMAHQQQPAIAAAASSTTRKAAPAYLNLKLAAVTAYPPARGVPCPPDG